MEVGLLEVLDPVDVDQDRFGLWCGSEYEVHIPDDVHHRVHTLPLFDELPVRCPGSSIKMDYASVGYREFPC